MGRFPPLEELIGCVSVALLAMSCAAADDGGRIRGYVIDPTGASLPAHIRLVTRDPKSPWIKGDTNQSGEFFIEDIPPGSYPVEAWATGFRANHVSEVVVSAGQTVDVGTIELNLIGCDDPGVICDDFGLSPKPDPHRIVARVGLTLSLGAGADLDRGRLAEIRSKKADLWLNGRDGELYLSPGDGARFSTLNPATAGCTDVHFDKRPVRIDGLGPGDDLCVRTKTGRFAHVLLTSEVPANSADVKIWIVTRK